MPLNSHNGLWTLRMASDLSENASKLPLCPLNFEKLSLNSQNGPWSIRNCLWTVRMASDFLETVSGISERSLNYDKVSLNPQIMSLNSQNSLWNLSMASDLSESLSELSEWSLNNEKIALKHGWLITEKTTSLINSLTSDQLITEISYCWATTSPGIQQLVVHCLTIVVTKWRYFLSMNTNLIYKKQLSLSVNFIHQFINVIKPECELESSIDYLLKEALKEFS